MDHNRIRGHGLIIQIYEPPCSSRDTKTHPLHFGQVSEDGRVATDHNY